MNALSLRVSSVKTSDNVRKNAEMRTAPIKLPMDYGKCQEWYCLQLRAAHAVPEQVACVKKIYQNVGNNIDVLQFLCDVLFNSPLKHPVRSQIVKLLLSSLQTAKENLENAITLGSASIQACLEKSLRKLITNLQSNENVNWNTAIASVSGCFDNFDVALKSLGRCIDMVFPVVCKSIDKYLADMPNLSSPSVRNEYYLYIHTSIRVLLNCIQEFGQSLKRTQLQFMQQLNMRCQQIIRDGDIPMDPRTNAGILIAYLAKLNNDYPNFVSYAQDIQNPHEIPLCVGIINTCGVEDFPLYASELKHICNKIDQIAKANATVPNILLCATRALFQISKQLLNLSLVSFECEAEIKEILEKLVEFSVAFMDHHMDSVRHISRDIMRNIVTVIKKQRFNEILSRIYDMCNSEHLSLSVKCVILQQATFALGADEVVRKCKTLFTHLFADNLGRDFVVNNLYEALMLANYKEQPFEMWSSVWISYLLKIASCQDSRLSDIETLIVKAIKCDVRLVHTLILNENENGAQEIPISTKLSTLWAVRKSGIHIDNFSGIHIYGLMQLFSQHIQLSILSSDDDTRIMALRLLVETNKTTEPLNTLEYDLLLTYLQFNGNCQSPATRQKSLSMLGKALTRCHLGLMKQTKGKECKAVLKENPLELSFLQAFMKILIENLFEGANFSRRSLSLQLLKQCFSIAVQCNLDLLSLLPSMALKALLTTLADSYESNKELAVNMLRMLETNQGDKSLVETNELNINLESIQTMLTSVRPMESVTASYQLEFLCHGGNVHLFGNFDIPSQSSCIYAALKWLLEQLKEGLKLAELSILEAAKHNPLYGLLFAVNHLLRNVDFALIAEEGIWRKLLAEYIILCKNLTNVVAPIVNSSSPEGHLPNDFSELPKELSGGKIASPDAESFGPCKILSSQHCKVDMASVKTTPQMVLICAWRTVKEVSLLLGDIVLHAAIKMSSECQRYLITKSQILEIGEHFKLLLSETKHRGAFEQAYVGFSKLCCRLWCMEAEDLNALPMLWLKDLITVISQEDENNGKICATRRSAGVPFMVQALITSELKVGTTKALMFCMLRLLQLCSAKDSSSESRTHALNILRALFRCTDLSEPVGEYVSEGVMAAIRGYDATNWSEKNSSTLLFAALITRIFGVQRTKDSDNLNIRNRMTGRVFFLRYPKLYDFFLEELKAASLLIENQQKANKLHPLLLILSRLYPSALEGTESNLKLSVFVPYISKCGGCPEMQTRILAAKAMVVLVTKDDLNTLLLDKCGDIKLLIATDGFSNLQLNILHGYLLQIFYLVKRNKSVLNEEDIADIIKCLFKMHKQTQLTNAVILKVVLDIGIEMISSSLSFQLKPVVLQHLMYFTSLPCLSDPNMIFYYPVVQKSKFLYTLYIMHLTMPTTATLADYMADIPVADISMEQLETCLNIILYILALDKHKAFKATTGRQPSSTKLNLTDSLEEFEILPTEMHFVHALSDTVFLELSTELKSSNTLYTSLIKILEIPKFYPAVAMKSYAIISFLKQFDLTLLELLKVSEIHSDDVKTAITMCVERIFESQGVNYDNAESCLEYLMEIAHPSQPYCLRLKAASGASYLSVHYPKFLKMRCLSLLRLYIRLLLMLLMDDDCDIRDLTTQLVLSSLQKDILLHFFGEPSIIISHKSQCVVSTVAQLVFLQYTAELLDSLAVEEGKDEFILDVFKIISCQDTAPTDGNEADTQNLTLLNVEIFDKSETNVYAEPLTIAMDAFEIFQRQFKNRISVVQLYNKIYK